MATIAVPQRKNGAIANSDIPDLVVTDCVMGKGASSMHVKKCKPKSMN
jgi:hypothetical protein